MMEAHCEVYCGEYLSSHTDINFFISSKTVQIEGEFLDDHTLPLLFSHFKLVS